MCKKRCNACSRVAALVGVGPIGTSCTFHGPTMTYQTDRIWHAKATPQLNKSPPHLKWRKEGVRFWLLLFFISTPHWCISKTASTKRHVTMLCKWKNCNTWLWEACCLIQASCSEEPRVLGLPSWQRKIQQICQNDLKDPSLTGCF